MHYSGFNEKASRAEGGERLIGQTRTEIEVSIAGRDFARELR
jgi:hypothetical protein